MLATHKQHLYRSFSASGGLAGPCYACCLQSTFRRFLERSGTETFPKRVSRDCQTFRCNTAVDTEYAKNPRWDVNIFIVANAAELQYIDQDLLVTKLREASLEIGGHELTPTLPEEQQGLDIPTCFTDFSGLSEPPLPSSSRCDSDEALEFTHYECLDLRWVNAASIWYTDGSAVKTKDDGTIIGSGAYCRSGEVKLRIAPCGDGPTNTSMRAELIAIYCCALPPQHQPF